MRWKDDEGVTLIELVVSMTIMAVMMTMFTTAAIQMYQAANKTESLGNAQSQLNTVFLRLDKVIRYASWISDVTQNSSLGTYSMKLLATVPPSTTASPAATTSSAQRCVGLKLSSPRNRLWITEWDPDISPSVAPTAANWALEPTDRTQNNTIWIQIAVDIDAPAGEKPFERIPADAVQNFDRVQLHLEATTGSNESRTRTDTDVRFTALNTSLARPTTDLCPLR